MLNFYYIWSLTLFCVSFFFLIIGLNFLLFNFSLIFEWMLFSSNSTQMNFIIYLDWVAMFFVFVVFFISSMVVLYSSVYMGDYNYGSIRFLFLVLLFVFSMLLMILSPSLVSIMLGWDGLGLVSYCLVIYYSSLKSYLAGMITCLINRLGDIGLLISIGWIFSYGSWNFIFYVDLYDELIFYTIIISSFTKSAQIPFSSWLPAAMAAPTPVSSLVHSSTLVTAGVYLLIRFYNYLIFINDLFLFISVMTMIMSSLCANYEFDLKKIIALSTLSQLGLMMSCLFMGLVDLAYFHLLSHAMFKSLLFLCSGIIIHLMGGCQDIRSMGSICLTMPMTCCCFNISNMALCGFPFLSGFYSKDLVIESSAFLFSNLFILMLFYMSLGLTALYSMRLFYYSILKKINYLGFFSLIDDISYMKLSIFSLSIFSISFGCMFMWLVNLDMFFLSLPLYLSILTMLMVMMGLYLGYELNFYSSFINLNYYLLNGSMWFMYSYSYSLYYFNYNYSLTLNYTQFWGEYYGGMGISYYLMKLANFFQLYSLNSLSIFFIGIVLWVMIIV
uniref:NADH dehydrogenase subunit 5 n=1 Tax=Phlogothamnus polymaculatus TaxID=2897054 RepID=UPI001EE0CEBF|nr:NADH dehydrogenase subunit 5 [Phlogothamnus polymaculatus]UKE80385.1 NADH dehydrogenase subunit 5 [Phlogothamnus polymaculatus]